MTGNSKNCKLKVYTDKKMKRDVYVKLNEESHRRL